MNENVLLSKIVANPTDATWSQAYSTLNLYVVLSIKSESQASIVTSGKELLERLQREYFSQDEKSLENIKKSVEKTIESVETNETISIVLATINQNILYIVIASSGEVILKRDEKIGIIGKGEEGKIIAFSGELTANDVVILETGDFSSKITVSKLSSVLDNLGVSEISENLAPLIHEESKGTEAAIVIQYKSGGRQEEEKPTESSALDEETKDDETIEELGIPDKSQTLLSVFLSKIKIPKVNILSTVFKLSRRKIITLAIIVLAILLLGSIMFEKSRQDRVKKEQALAEIFAPAQKKYDEALALTSLNKGLALEEFESIKKTLEEARSQFGEKSSERKKLDEFIGKIEGKIGEIGAGASVSNQKVILENVDFVSFREGLVAVDTNGKIFLLSKTGKTEKEINSKNENVKALSSDDKYIYLLGDGGITRTNKGTGATTTIVPDVESAISIDNFGSNIYALNTKEKTIDKYVGSNKLSYFAEDITLNSPISMTIDASIWVLDGKIRKFTRGREDSFSIQGLTGNLENNSKIATSPDFSNIYILDPKNARIVSVKKDGEAVKQYSWRDLSAATSFAVDEKGETIYVVIKNKLYSFDL